ncbi:MAG: hypothetical protein RJP95_02570 [Pirellulales bacterium]
MRKESLVVVAFLFFDLLLGQLSSVSARDILLIDDFSGGFGATAGILSSAGHTVTELTDEVAGGYSRVSDTTFLGNYDMVIYAARNGVVPPPTANSAMESYIRNGGDLLVTGFGGNPSIPDRSAPDLLRAMGPEFGYYVPDTDQVVNNVDNYITNEPYGDFRGATITNSNGFDQLFANKGLGTVSLVEAAGGQPDKIIFTDLPGAGGSVGAWQGRVFTSGNPAQPDFYDGGTFQGMLLNWAEGGTTTQTEVTPSVFSTATHPLQSNLSVDLYLGDPNNGGTYAATAGPINIEGTMDIVGALDGSGDGSLAITNASLGASGISDLLVDFGQLGTVLLDVNLVEIYIANQTTNVTANSFDIATSPYYVAGLTEADIELHSPEGGLQALLAGLVPLDFELEDVYYGGPDDFVDPVFVGTYDEGSGLFTGRPELNLTFDNAAFPLFDVDGLGDIYAVINGEIHVAFVPEPSSWLLGCLAVFGFVALCRRNRFRNRTL